MSAVKINVSAGRMVWIISIIWLLARKKIGKVPC